MLIQPLLAHGRNPAQGMQGAGCGWLQVAGQHCAAWLGWLQAKASSCFRNAQARGSAPSSWPCQQSQSHWLDMVGTRMVTAVVTVPGLVQSVLVQQQGHILHGHKGKAARSWKLFARKVC